MIGKKTTGIIVEIKRQYWLQVNQKPFRRHSLDSALFPYIATVKYTVGGVDYFKKKWIDATATPPMVGSYITVIYSEKNPKKARAVAFGEPEDGRPFSPIVFFFIFLAFSLMLAGVFCIMLNYRNLSDVEYDELIYMELTVDEIASDHDPEMGITYKISVRETDKPLIINNILTDGEVIKGLKGLDNGDKIYCYLIDGGTNYDVAEIKAEYTILSLERYKDIYKRQSQLGFIVSPIAFVLTFGMSIKCLVDHVAEKKNNKKIYESSFRGLIWILV